MHEELTSSTEESIEDDAQPLLLWVCQTVWSSRQDTAESVSCQKLDLFVGGVLRLQGMQDAGPTWAVLYG